VEDQPVIGFTLYPPDSPAGKRESGDPSLSGRPWSSQGQALDPRFRGGNGTPLN
jgi:hypothetical protein